VKYANAKIILMDFISDGNRREENAEGVIAINEIVRERQTSERTST